MDRLWGCLFGRGHRNGQGAKWKSSPDTLSKHFREKATSHETKKKYGWELTWSKEQGSTWKRKMEGRQHPQVLSLLSLLSLGPVIFVSVGTRWVVPQGTWALLDASEALDINSQLYFIGILSPWSCLILALRCISEILYHLDKSSL